jgi:hypothetical protein
MGGHIEFETVRCRHLQRLSLRMRPARIASVAGNAIQASTKAQTSHGNTAWRIPHRMTSAALFPPSTMTARRHIRPA